MPKTKAPDAVTPPDGSQCASCTAFAGGTCPTFMRVADALEQAVPFVSYCPDFAPPPEAVSTTPADEAASPEESR